MVSRNELQQKAERLEVMKDQLESMQGQKQMIEENIKAHAEAKKTMKKYQEKEKGTEVLVPIGADSYLHTEVSNNEEVMIGLGNDLSAKKNIEDALEIIERKKDKVKEQKQELEEDIEELNENLKELQQEVQEEYQEFQRQQQQQRQQQGGGQVFQ